MVGEDRAIVTEVPGTTRDHIEVPISLGGVPILLTDTAGLRESSDHVEAIGIARASALVGNADVLVWLGEPQDVPDRQRTLRVHAKSDLAGRETPEGSIAVSSLTGEGMVELLRQIETMARELLPREDSIALNRRQALHVEEAAEALAQATHSGDLVLAADDLRVARSAFDRLTGRAGVEDVLDALFSRFCLGK
jgi:tRNA modification GTPase